jgi:crotonobetainyl-CoA:carnitine CoA-transferase CaiB-like acyl-CoA transferase
VLGLEEWGRSPQAATNAARLKHRTGVMDTLRAAIRGWRRDALVEACVAAGVPAGPIYAVDEVLADPHFRARGAVAEFDYAPVGTFSALPVPLRFEGLDGPAVGPPPMLGEHTEAILRGRLGMDAGTIATLRAEGVI